ncbi:hypothetical protein PMALA_034200 [Plasmodium malariae]|uniref:Uncharacterized protein n=1 Tax=Plasmodium malariae TaxID=5858 RepID=A0A1A8WKL0_PLAMA|nr:hypothetical protein PMALA_034200 [Plasmodium malariae]
MAGEYTYDSLGLSKCLPRERAWQNQRGKKTLLSFILYQEGNLTRAVHLLLNLNADVQRQAQREQKSLRRSFLILRYQLFLSLGRRSLKVSDCSPANRERKLGLDLREIVGSDNWYSNWLTNQCCEAKSVG